MTTTCNTIIIIATTTITVIITASYNSIQYKRWQHAVHASPLRVQCMPHLASRATVDAGNLTAQIPQVGDRSAVAHTSVFLSVIILVEAESACVSGRLSMCVQHFMRDRVQVGKFCIGER
jgi:hypothetical protein